MYACQLILFMGKRVKKLCAKQYFLKIKENIFQGHPTDRFGKLSVRKAFITL